MNRTTNTALRAAMLDVLSKADKPLTGYEVLLAMRKPPHNTYVTTQWVYYAASVMGGRVRCEKRGKFTYYSAAAQERETATEGASDATHEG